MYIYIHLLMNSPHLIDQILNFYKSYLVENLPFLILLAFAMHVIFVLRIFGCTDSCNLWLGNLYTGMTLRVWWNHQIIIEFLLSEKGGFAKVVLLLFDSF